MSYHQNGARMEINMHVAGYRIRHDSFTISLDIFDLEYFLLTLNRHCALGVDK